MQYTQLGKTNLRVSRFCLGTMMFGGKTAEDESIRILHRALDAGVNFVDTADVYNAGASEEIVGKGLEGRRDGVVLASKFGMAMGQGANDVGVSRFHIVRSVEASLRRLRTDRIDLMYIHWPMEAMHLEEPLRALEDLIRAGKILYPACSNYPAWLLMRALWLQDVHGYAPLAAGQYPYNLIERGVEVELLPAAKAMGVGIVVYRPLSAGALTAKYLDEIPAGARGEQDGRLDPWTKKYADGIRRLRAMAEERGYTAADAAVAWVRSHPAVTAPIVGISHLDQLEANLKGFAWEMTAEEREDIGRAFPTEVWEESGGRFPFWRRSFDIIPS
ncbi:MAG: aldo/keto reductase [Chloroflexi bacterium]|nr:aldo/keto reductase [Chloroflexota bacterium]